MLDIEKINLKDKKTFDMLCEGKTLTVFQLESRLLSHWSKKLRPRSIDDIALLVSIVRPGVLEALDENGRSMAEVICLRKNGEEPVSYYHPSLEPILNDTYGVVVYQEQISRISREIAGFTGGEAENMRKIISKKDQAKLAKISDLFIDKATKHGVVNKEQAESIMEGIRKAGRYAFNRAHAYSYAYLACKTAYLKAHYPRESFCAALIHSDSSPDPQEEISKIIEECKSEKIDVLLPSILKPEERFFIDGNDIRFGLASISGLGVSNINALRKSIKEIEKKYKKIQDFSWYEFLVLCCHKAPKHPKFTPSVITSLIEAGAMDHFGVHRRRMLHELSNYIKLSPKEQEWNIDNYALYDNLVDLLKNVGRTSKDGGGTQKSRLETVDSIRQLIENPPSELNDTVDWLITKERKLLGVNLTASRLDKFNPNWVNAYIADFNNGEQLPHPAYFAVEIEAVHPTTTKKGKNPGQAMAKLIVSDKSAKTKSACVLLFPKVWEKYADLCEQGNLVVLNAEVSKDGDALFVNEMSLL